MLIANLKSVQPLNQLVIPVRLTRVLAEGARISTRTDSEMMYGVGCKLQNLQKKPYGAEWVTELYFLFDGTFRSNNKACVMKINKTWNFTSVQALYK